MLSPLSNQAEMTRIQANYWLAQGVSVIPCRPRTKVAAIHWLELQWQMPIQNKVDLWFGPGSQNNLAVITGGAKGLVVIDFDNLDFFKLWQGLYQVKTFMVRTGRGVHVYLFCDQPVKCMKFPGALDVKGKGGYVLTPPSVHPSGSIYEVLQDLPIARIHNLVEVLPADLLEKDQPAAAREFPDLDLIRAEIQVQRGSDPWTTAMAGQVDVIKMIKAQISIMALLGSELFPSGKDFFLCRCPFHPDKNPSFWVDKKHNLCGCYSGCTGRLPMDQINLWAKLRGISNSEAIRDLARLL
jgi:hypothetical protein